MPALALKVIEPSATEVRPFVPTVLAELFVATTQLEPTEESASVQFTWHVGRVEDVPAAVVITVKQLTRYIPTPLLGMAYKVVNPILAVCARRLTDTIDPVPPPSVTEYVYVGSRGAAMEMSYVPGADQKFTLPKVSPRKGFVRADRAEFEYSVISVPVQGLAGGWT